MDHFAGAVGAELPALVRPQHRDHGETEGGDERMTSEGRIHRRVNFRGVFAVPESEDDEDAAKEHDDADFDEGGDILEIGTFARAPDVDESNGGDHKDRDDEFTC